MVSNSIAPFGNMTVLIKGGGGVLVEAFRIFCNLLTSLHLALERGQNELPIPFCPSEYTETPFPR